MVQLILPTPIATIKIKYLDGVEHMVERHSVWMGIPLHIRGKLVATTLIVLSQRYSYSEIECKCHRMSALTIMKTSSYVLS